MGQVEVGEHLQLGDLVGQVQEGLGVHLDLVLSLLSLLQGLVSGQSVSASGQLMVSQLSVSGQSVVSQRSVSG